MSKIDVHTHILPRDIPKWKDRFGYGGFIALEHYDPCCAHMMRDDGKQFRDVEENSRLRFDFDGGGSGCIGSGIG